MKELRARKIGTLFLVILPVLGTYGFFSRSITFADIFGATMLVYLVENGIIRKKLQVRDWLFLLFATWVLISIVLSALTVPNYCSEATIFQFIKIVVYSLLITLSPINIFDIKIAKRYYTRIAIVLSVIVFIQYILYLITNSYSPWVINNNLFPAIYVGDDYFSGGYTVMLGNGFYRPSSIFSEPALFAQYIAPCLAINIFSDPYPKRRVVVALLAAAIVLGKSANGIIYIAAIGTFYLITKLVKIIKNKNNIIKASSFATMLVFIVSIPILTPVINKVIFGSERFSVVNRFSEINDKEGESSGSMRVSRGWMIYSGMTFSEKMVGIGSGNIVNYLSSHPGQVKKFSHSYNGYMSGLSAIFVNSGIVGGCVFAVWLIRKIADADDLVKSLVVFLLIYLIASNSFYTTHFVFTVILIVSLLVGEHNNMSIYNKRRIA